MQKGIAPMNRAQTLYTHTLAILEASASRQLHRLAIADEMEAAAALMSSEMTAEHDDLQAAQHRAQLRLVRDCQKRVREAIRGHGLNAVDRTARLLGLILAELVALGYGLDFLIWLDCVCSIRVNARYEGLLTIPFAITNPLAKAKASAEPAELPKRSAAAVNVIPLFPVRAVSGGKDDSLLGAVVNLSVT